MTGGWRYKVAFSIVLSLTQLVLMAYMPESPRSVPRRRDGLKGFAWSLRWERKLGSGVVTELCAFVSSVAQGTLKVFYMPVVADLSGPLLIYRWYLAKQRRKDAVTAMTAIYG